jgi:protein-S-isoprenylcysteine O-methyltransferase Ste14
MFRWPILAVLLGALTISGYHRARARQSGDMVARRREGPLFLTLRGLMAVALFGSLIGYVVSPPAMAWASFELPVALRWVALGLAILMLPAIHWVLATLGRNVTETVFTKEHHELVMRGPYRWVRHPLYTTGLTLFLALGLVAGNWFVLLTSMLAYALLRWVVIPREEAALVSRFGSQYRSYVQQTGRLVPRPLTRERIRK